MRTPWSVVLLSVVLLGLPAAAHAGAPLLRADDAQLEVREASKAAAPGAIEVEVRLGGKPATLQLAPNTQLEADAARFAPSIQRGEDRLYAGVIAGAPGTWVRVSRVGGGWIGVVFDGTELWYLEPARRHAKLAAARGFDAGATLAYRGGDLDLPQGIDLHGIEPGPGADTPAKALGPLATAGTPRYLKITLVLDTEFQAIYAENSAAAAVAILNGTDGIYRAQTDIQITLNHLEVLASNGTLTSTDAPTLLEAFSNFVRTGGVPFAGLAHLLSGKDFGGPAVTTVGLAYVGAVCSFVNGYGINQATFTTAATSTILAHEIGHNFGAFHDSDGNICPSSGFIMAASSNLSTPATSFSACSLNYFSTYFQSGAVFCLTTPQDAVFRNGFEP